VIPLVVWFPVLSSVARAVCVLLDNTGFDHMNRACVMWPVPLPCEHLSMVLACERHCQASATRSQAPLPCSWSPASGHDAVHPQGEARATGTKASSSHYHCGPS
jgi:hypothetical protein